MSGRHLFTVAIAVSLVAVPAAAQSLGDLARQEEARRASIQKASKTLSNADLDPSAIVAPAGVAPAGDAPAEPSCYMSKQKGQCVSAAEMLANSVAGVVTKDNAPHEQTWRDESAALRSQIENTQRSIATLEAVVADNGRSPGDRKSAGQLLADARQAIERLQRQWEKHEKMAGNQKVPRVWLEPIPVFTKN
jgi:hypothetical protein